VDDVATVEQMRAEVEQLNTENKISEENNMANEDVKGVEALTEENMLGMIGQKMSMEAMAEATGTKIYQIKQALDKFGLKTDKQSRTRKTKATTKTMFAVRDAIVSGKTTDEGIMEVTKIDAAGLKAAIKQLKAAGIVTTAYAIVVEQPVE
jgi:hypothetical protein